MDTTSPTSLSRTVKMRGWLLVLIGPALCAGMAGLAYYLALTVNNLDPGHGSRWHGSHEMTVLTFSIFGAIFLFGLLSIVNGISLLRRGRVHPVALALTILLALTMAGLGYCIVTTGAPP